jgi:hypothetical protein
MKTTLNKMVSFEVGYNWKEYKQDTKYVAGYPLRASQTCGYKRHVNTTNLNDYSIQEK